MSSQGPESKDTRKLGSYMIYAMWVVLLGMLTFFMQQWLDKEYNPNRQVQINEQVGGIRQVVLKRNRYGHYVSSGKVNGEDAIFFVDTGATDVVIPMWLGERFNLKPGRAFQAGTANGVVTVFATQIDKVELGPIILRDVRGSLNPHMDGEEILLGMSFLKHVELTQRQGELILNIPH